jgi:branched-chain amino acid transport system substrate-binding protein
LSFGSVIEQAGAKALEGTMMAQSIIQDTAIERRASFIARYARHSKESRIGSLMAAAQTYDAVYLMLHAMFKTKGDTSGTALKRALEHLDLNYQGVVTTYASPFSEHDHDAFTLNSVWLGVWRNGQIGYYYPEDARRSAYIRRKQPSR